ncbi:hypothetical protein [Acrocarpospora catenulata]|uniref:CdiA C-terminal domain-containing protein n=1 Tax=Acrocarpospora catenulata TaxID=2836182 RepID=UPI001BDB034A|nr:hypothetical protein [Acrocarpospora catenulata]
MREDRLSGVDERARAFSESERRVAEFLAAEGHQVVAVADQVPTPCGRIGHRPDALVDGVATDFVVLGQGGTSAAVAMALSRAARHADQAVVDARGSGLTAAAAQDGVRRFQAVAHSRRLAAWRLIGDAYDIRA